MLLAVSGIGTGCGLVCLGLFTYFQTNGYNVTGLGWIPVTSFSFIIFIANWGLLAVPFLFIAEIMPENVKMFCLIF